MEKALITVSGRNMPKFEAISDANKARLVARQFERVENALGNAVQEMVVFGAILEAIDKTLEERNAIRSTKKRNQYSEETLKAWLAKHCPKVNYETARSYLQAARGVRELAKIAEDVPLLPLMGENPLTDAHMEKQRKRVMDIVAKSSLRLLRGAGTKKSGTVAVRGEVKKYSAEDRAVNKWVDILMAAGDAYAKSSIADLPLDKARGALEVLNALVGALKRRIARG